MNAFQISRGTSVASQTTSLDHQAERACVDGVQAVDGAAPPAESLQFHELAREAFEQFACVGRGSGLDAAVHAPFDQLCLASRGAEQEQVVEQDAGFLRLGGRWGDGDWSKAQFVGRFDFETGEEREGALQQVVALCGLPAVAQVGEVRECVAEAAEGAVALEGAAQLALDVEFVEAVAEAFHGAERVVRLEARDLDLVRVVAVELREVVEGGVDPDVDFAGALVEVRHGGVAAFLYRVEQFVHRDVQLANGDARSVSRFTGPSAWSALGGVTAGRRAPRGALAGEAGCEGRAAIGYRVCPGDAAPPARALILEHCPACPVDPVRAPSDPCSRGTLQG